MPFPFVTHVNFAGTDESTLFVTIETDANNLDWVYSGKLYRVVVDQPPTPACSCTALHARRQRAFRDSNG